MEVHVRDVRVQLDDSPYQRPVDGLILPLQAGGKFGKGNVRSAGQVAGSPPGQIQWINCCRFASAPAAVWKRI